MDNSYRITAEIHAPKLVPVFNMHELNIIEDGKKGLAILGKAEFADISVLGLDIDVGWVLNLGFREFDIATGETLFEWWAMDHVPLDHSNVKIENINGPHPRGWNWLYVFEF